MNHLYLQHVVGERVEDDVHALSSRLMADVLLKVGRARVREVSLRKSREPLLEVVALLLSSDGREDLASVFEGDRNSSLTNTARATMGEDLEVINYKHNTAKSNTFSPRRIKARMMSA